MNSITGSEGDGNFAQGSIRMKGVAKACARLDEKDLLDSEDLKD
jgi:hypothetical protein